MKKVSYNLPEFDGKDDVTEYTTKIWNPDEDDYDAGYVAQEIAEKFFDNGDGDLADMTEIEVVMWTEKKRWRIIVGIEWERTFHTGRIDEIQEQAV